MAWMVINFYSRISFIGFWSSRLWLYSGWSLIRLIYMMLYVLNSLKTNFEKKTSTNKMINLRSFILQRSFSFNNTNLSFVFQSLVLMDVHSRMLNYRSHFLMNLSTKKFQWRLLSVLNVQIPTDAVGDRSKHKLVGDRKSIVYFEQSSMTDCLPSIDLSKNVGRHIQSGVFHDYQWTGTHWWEWKWFYLDIFQH